MTTSQAVMTRAATVKDVALKAGVSVGTVSRVLNNHPNVNIDNSGKVRQAIMALGYRKSQAAQILASRRNHRQSLVRTGNIGVYLPGIGMGGAANPLWAAYLSGIEQACREKGYHFIGEFGKGKQGQEPPDCVREGKVDGLLIKLAACPAFVEQLPKDMPVVGLCMSSPVPGMHRVEPDGWAAGSAVTDYLWKRGHRRIAFANIHAAHSLFIHRYQGYEEYLRGREAFDAELVAISTDTLLKDGEAPDMSGALDRLLSLPADRRPTAIIAANDGMAAGVYSNMRNRGLTVPDDLSVVGFDNMVHICGTLEPPLTSYAIPFARSAHLAASILIDLLEKPENRSNPHNHLVIGELIERESVKTLIENKKQEEAMPMRT